MKRLKLTAETIEVPELVAEAVEAEEENRVIDFSISVGMDWRYQIKIPVKLEIEE